jgi:hypothetical protein
MASRFATTINVPFAIVVTVLIVVLLVWYANYTGQPVSLNFRTVF